MIYPGDGPALLEQAILLSIPIIVYSLRDIYSKVLLTVGKQSQQCFSHADRALKFSAYCLPVKHWFAQYTTDVYNSSSLSHVSTRLALEKLT